ncbi:hypothetical protein [Neochlamydia sp. S13]|uniref:hypothetical protein n=1 Tax=Neochlamydia sp. S13 TaxID=1353976 RepID=UPI0013151920|nr:hypothetical protein [Neochlamydia sp. S13]
MMKFFRVNQVELHMVFIDHKKLQITNLKERHRIILRCLGPPYQKFYYSEMW